MANWLNCWINSKSFQFCSLSRSDFIQFVFSLCFLMYLSSCAKSILLLDTINYDWLAIKFIFFMRSECQRFSIVDLKIVVDASHTQTHTHTHMHKYPSRCWYVESQLWRPGMNHCHHQLIRIFCGTCLPALPIARTHTDSSAWEIGNE